METINNNSNVYILGAGFSRPRGMPLVADFMLALRDAHEWLVAQHRTKEAEAIERVLGFRKDSMSAAYRVRIDLENIEELFSLASATNDELSDQIKLAIAATLDFRASTINQPTSSFEYRITGEEVPILERWREKVGNSGNPDSARFDVPTYEFFCASLLGTLGEAKVRKNCFITLNYDLVVENALWSLGCGFDYCFGQRAVVYDPSFRKGENPESLPLLKLHGSLNWAFPGGQGGKLRIFHTYNEVRNADLVPELVPPTWRKSFTSQISVAWERARVEISKATRIVIVGFSMPPTDLHFKYLLAAGLRDNISLREIVFVDIESDAVTNRAQDLFGDLLKRPQVRVIGGGIQGFSNCGTMAECVWSVGRPISRSISSIQHR